VINPGGGGSFPFSVSIGIDSTTRTNSHGCSLLSLWQAVQTGITWQDYPLPTLNYALLHFPT
jgi:hypothetical protein